METTDSSKAVVELRNPTALSESSDFVRVAALKRKMEALLELQEVLRHNAATRVLAVLENSIRIGWCIIDIKSELRGGFYIYAENNFPFSVRHAERLMKAAKNFQRDGQNVSFLQTLTTQPIEYPYSEKPLLEQVKETGAQHFQDLLVTSGIAPAKQIVDPSQRITVAGFFKLARAIDAAVARLVRYQRESEVQNWGDGNREIIKRKMQPLVEFWKENLE